MIFSRYSEWTGSWSNRYGFSTGKSSWSGRTLNLTGLDPMGLDTKQTESHSEGNTISYAETRYHPRRGHPYYMLYYCSEYWRRG